jgi:hypothetical protein
MKRSWKSFALPCTVVLLLASFAAEAWAAEGVQTAQTLRQQGGGTGSVCESGDGNAKCVCPGQNCAANQTTCTCLTTPTSGSNSPTPSEQLKAK